MGIENRDYVRRPSFGGGGFSGFSGDGGFAFPPVCKWLIIANVAVFVLQLVVTRPVSVDDFRRGTDATSNELEEISTWTARERQEYAARIGLPRTVSVVQKWLELDPRDTVRRGQVWRLVAYAFCHDRSSVWHILMNMLFLWWFGPTLERMYGSREFVVYYLTAAVVAAAAFLAMGFALGSVNPMIGASGAIMAVRMLFAWHFPRHTILIFFIIPVEIRWIVLLYVIFDLYPVLQQIGGEVTNTGVAHMAHLGGLAFGFLYAKYDLNLSRRLAGLRAPRLRGRIRRPKHVRIYEPPREDLDQQVDRILQKIHEQGEASLTEQERAVLKDASQRYKQR